MKVALVCTFVLLTTIVLLELASLVVYYVVKGRAFTYESSQAQVAERLAEVREKLHPDWAPKGTYILHPYLGFTGRPNRPGSSETAYNEFGIRSESNYPYPYKKQSDEFVIGVTGGSVAAQFANGAEQDLRTILARANPLFRKRRVVVIPLALGGFKQPQQLFMFVYTLLSGGEYNLILNIDGFNEIVLATENTDRRMNPIYPSGFHMSTLLTTATNLDSKTLEAVYEIRNEYRREERILSALQRPPLSYSVFSCLAGMTWSRRSERGIRRIEYRLVNEAQEGLWEDYRGPALGDRKNKYEQAAQIWMRTSEMLNALCRQQGLHYVHLLQPNQYVPGSKPLSEHERKVAYAPQSPWSVRAREGYPFLRGLGGQLRAKGVRFYDLTFLFQNVTDDLYVDECCHLGPAGNTLLAQVAADAIVAAVNGQPAESVRIPTQQAAGSQAR